MERLPSIIPLVVAVFFIRNIIKIGAAAARKQSPGSGRPRSTVDAAQPVSDTSKRPKRLSNSAPPKPWQIGKHDVTSDKPALNGKRSNAKAFGQRFGSGKYESAFERKDIFSEGPVAAFGDERDAISSGSMAAVNAAYMDVGNDYVSSFEVGRRRETPAGFDR